MGLFSNVSYVGGISPSGGVLRIRNDNHWETCQKRIYAKMPYFIRKKLGQRQTLRYLMILVGLAIVFLLFQLWMITRIEEQQQEQKQDELNVQDHFVHVQEAPDKKSEKVDDHVQGVRGGKFSAGFLLGVAPELKHLYKPDAQNQFQCIEGKERIDFDQVCGRKIS